MSKIQGQAPRSDLASISAGLGNGIDKLVASFGPLAPMGAVTCYRARPFAASDRRIVEALTAQSAVLLASVERSKDAAPLVGRLAGQASLDSAKRALFDIGWRPGPTHPVVIRLQSSQFRAPADFDRLVQAVSTTCSQFDGVVIVPSPPSDSRSAHARATSARRRSLCSPSASVVVSYDDVAHLRGVPRVALEIGPTLAEGLTKLRTISRYDMGHGTELTKTLDMFLSNGSSMNDTAERLFIHRNTLRQRLARIEELIGRPSEEIVADRTTFALAARLMALDLRAHPG